MVYKRHFDSPFLEEREMAWQETNVLKQKELFIKAWLSGRYTKTSLCGRFGISRPTGDK